ncbi:MAG: aminopeptidase P family protein [Clostridiales bacterium]|nr:aminopeptidase P family protein [Clostridiales bacterium]
MKKEIVELQKIMLREGIDVFFEPAGDPHGSEYVNDHYKACEFLSGLTAENEALVVTQEGAYIWTDGRFFLQADRQLAGSGIELMKMAVEGVPTVMEFMLSLADKAAEAAGSDGKAGDRRFVIGFDGNTAPAGLYAELSKTFEGRDDVEFRWDADLASEVWKERPEIVPSKIWEFPLTSAGKSASEKISEVRKAMAEKGADCLILTDLMETAWLLNLRGADILYTPVFFSYILLTQDECRLYVMDGSLDELKSCGTENGLPEGLGSVSVRNYEDIYADAAAIPADRKVWMDLSSANCSLYMQLQSRDKIINELTPVALAKTVKNETEIRSTLNAHIKDGVAVTKFIKWIKEAACSSAQTEISAADRLEGFRSEQDGWFDLSFETISGYGPNAAIIHYAPTPETDLEIRPEGFLLVDSGGQYIDGTTDITRTIAVGPLTQEMIDDYTLVLKGHIALSTYVIRPETTHKELDEATRTALRARGLDYGHGVSHGVGHVLAVHEGPAGVRKKDEPCGLVPGMIVSNEPGYYKAGEFGIRIENEILFKDGGNGTAVSEPITMVPYEREAINVSLLTDEEIRWVNDYHKKVRETLLPLVDEETAEFVIRETEPLVR